MTSFLCGLSAFRIPASIGLMLFVVVSCSLDASWADERATSSVAANSDSIQAQMEFVTGKIQPLLESRCYECHGAVDEPKGGLSLLSLQDMLTGGDSGPAIDRSSADDSLLIQAVRYEGYEMPPRTRLPQEEVDLLVRWIEMGAPWTTDKSPAAHSSGREPFPIWERRESHWAWRPIRRPEVPAVSRQHWAEDDIDRFLLNRMEKAGLVPVEDAERPILLRRIYNDLIGLNPTAEQLKAFVEDPRPVREVSAETIDQLLDQPQFGERWARHWLDLVRYGDTLGHEFDYPLPHAWQYRDYVIRALNEDVPYDQFLTEHIAGDLLTQPRRNSEHGFNESIIATGFWFLGEDKHAPVDVRGEEAARIDNQLDVFSRAFLGLTVACARCHDHKFDAISTRDYYALAGFLQSSRRRIHYLDQNGVAAARVSDAIRLRSELIDLLKRESADIAVEDVALRLVSMVTAQASGADDHTTEPGALAESPLPAEQDPLAILATDNTGQQSSSVGRFSRWANQLLKRMETNAATCNVGLLFADFKSGLPEGWFVHGRAWEHLIAGTRDASLLDNWALIVTESGPAAELRAGVSSRVLGHGFRGTLSSPTFTLNHPEILIRVAGENSRVRLIVDGYVMHEFSELLFKGLRQKIDTEGESRWIRLGGDLSRYMGHRCHLEFLDEGDGWFRVEEIQFAASSGSPPQVEQSGLSGPMQKFAAETDPSEDIHEICDRMARALMQRPDWPVLALRLGLLDSTTTDKVQHLLARRDDLANATIPGAPVVVMQDGTPENEHVFVRGSHRNLGEVAPRHFLTALVPDHHPGFQLSGGSGRRELAELLLNEQNPFPARVMVNRIWRRLFGKGLVESVDNFGVLGTKPSHPELLDLLASDFRKDGWSIKRMVRRVMLTRAYRMSSVSSAEETERDPTNQWLSHANVRRLDAETIRDSMLQLAGHLDTVLYGRPVPVPLTSFMQGRGRPNTSGPLDGDGRRSIYLSVNRNFLMPFFQVFDTPAPATTVGARSESNVPAQALMLLNNEFVRQQAERWSQRILSTAPASGREAVRIAWIQALCREPTPREFELIEEFAIRQAKAYGESDTATLLNEKVLTDVCHAILNQKEFLFLQ